MQFYNSMRVTTFIWVVEDEIRIDGLQIWFRAHWSVIWLLPVIKTVFFKVKVVMIGVPGVTRFSLV